MTTLSKGKEQIFPYSLKTVGLTDKVAVSAGVQMGLEIINPQNLYTVEALAFHFKFTDSTVGRTITRVAVNDAFPSGSRTRYIDVNKAPVGLTTELKMDISSLLNPTGRNVIIVTFDSAASGNIDIFKADMLYTVLGIYQ